MSEAPRLILISPDQSCASFHDFLTSPDGMDKVHTITGKDELLAKRLGYANHNKRCFALVSGEGEGLKTLAAIYTYAASISDADETWKMLPGKIAPIVEAPSEEMTGEPKVIAFYSISSFGIGVGKQLIKSLYAQFTSAANTPILTTLSPLRTLKDYVGEQGFAGYSEDAKLAKVIEYLKERKDAVQRFHLGNGAQIGAIHLNAAEPGTKDGDLGLGVMISYRYPRREERIEENLGIYNEAGRIPASYHLAHAFK